MGERLQVGTAPEANSPDPQQPRRTVRDSLLDAWGKIFPPTGSPLESEYGALQAANIGAGAASSSAVDQARRAFRRGAGAIAGMGGNAQEAQRMNQLAGQDTAQMNTEGQMYAPMREAYPYATAFGETAPIIVTSGLAAARAQAGYNVGREYLDEIAKATQSPRLATMVKALRKF